jgi:hypothetical protein
LQLRATIQSAKVYQWANSADKPQGLRHLVVRPLAFTFRASQFLAGCPQK